jgi:Na+-driven multidrug efflux pump
LRLGAKGAALATSVSQLSSLLYLMSVFVRGSMRVPLRLDLRVVSAGTVMNILRVGLPQGLSEVFVAFFLFAINGLVVSIDPEALTAFGLCARLDQVVLLSIAAISAAVMTAVAQNGGRGYFARVREIQKVAVLIGMSVVLLQVILLMVSAPRILAWFTDVQTVIRYAVAQIRMVDLFYILSVVTLTAQAFFLAIGHPWPAVCVQSLKLFCVSLPVAFVLVCVFDIGMYGVWVGMIAGEGVGASLSAIWCFRSLDGLAAGRLPVART